jgi:hypothetical protein
MLIRCISRSSAMDGDTEDQGYLSVHHGHVLKTMRDLYQFCFYNNLENDLKADRAMTCGPVAVGHRIIARARAQGWRVNLTCWPYARAREISLNLLVRYILKPESRCHARYF